MNDEIKDKQTLTAEMILSNDEASTDEELRAHLVTELGLTEESAEALVAKRDAYLRGELL